MMKRVVLLLVVLLCAAASYGQIPYKIKNPYLYQSWEGDSANVLIRNFNGGDPDSVLYQTTTPVYIMWSSVYWPAFSPGIADTNILFVDAATGQVGITSPSAIGGAAASKWTYTGSTLRPIDTAKYVAIGTTNARSKWLYVDGNYNLNDGWFKQLSDLWAGRRFTGMYGRYNAKQTWMNGMLDLTADGFPHKMFFGYIYDTTTFGFTHRRIALTIDTIKGADLTASNVPGLPNEGVHVSAVSLTTAHVLEGDIEVDTLGVAMSRKIFNSTSQLQMRQFKVTDTGWVWVKQNFGDLNRYQKMKLDTNGYLTINNVYTLPNADGNPNDVLTTDGSGTVSWAAAAPFDSTLCHTLKLDSVNNCNDKVVFSGEVQIDDTLHLPDLASSGVTLLEIDSLGRVDSISTIDLATDTLPSLYVTDLSVVDTLFIGDSTYIIEEADTLRIYTPKDVKIGNSSLIVKANGDVHITGDLTYAYPHGFMAFKDSAEVFDLTQNVYTKITNTTNNLYTSVEFDYLTKAGDTITITTAGDYYLNSNIRLHGANGKTFRYAVFKNGAEEWHTSTVTSGVNNTMQLNLQYYFVNLAVGDDLSFRITCTTDNSDPTIVGGSVYIKKEPE